MPRGTNPNSRKNLEKGRQKGKGKGEPSNAAGGAANTFKAIIDAVGTLDLPDDVWVAFGELGITKDWAAAHGITDFRKLAKVVALYLDNSVPAVRELFDRSEGKVPDQVKVEMETPILIKVDR